jgi:ribose 5-phosphate isomerase B
VVGSDHAGFELKRELADHLRANGHHVHDIGTDSTASVDYPDFGAAVGRFVADGRAELGIAVCGSGIGIAMAANKVDGVRAAAVCDATAARLSRQHNDANVLCLGQRLIGTVVAIDAVDSFLSASFAEGRHRRRVDKISKLESPDL